MKLVALMIFALFSVAPLTVFSAETDPCEIYKDRPVAPLSKARLCDNAISVHKDAISDEYLTSTLDTIEGFFDAYAYKDYAINSGPPYNIKTDIRTMIKGMRQDIADKKVTSAREFHDKLGAAFVSLHDAHTIYLKPKCFGIQLFMPFYIRSKLNKSGDQVIYLDSLVEDPILDAYKTHVDPSFNSDDWKALLGSEIAAIDGTNALDALKAEDTFISKDPGPRLNYQVQSYFAANTIVFPLPKGDSVDLMLIHAKTGASTPMTVSWGVINAAGHSAPSTDELAMACVNPKKQEFTQSLVSVPGEAKKLSDEMLAEIQATSKIASGGGNPIAEAAKMANAERTAPAVQADANSRAAAAEAIANNDNDNGNSAAVAAAALSAANTAGRVPPALTAIQANNSALFRAAGGQDTAQSKSISEAVSSFTGSKAISRSLALDILAEERAGILPAAKKALASTQKHDEKLEDDAEELVADQKLGVSFDVDDYTVSILYQHDNAFLYVFGLTKKDAPAGTAPSHCIVRVPGFMPITDPACTKGGQECQDEAVEAALVDIEKGIDSLANARCERISFDVIGNGGGMICLGYRLMSQVIRGFNDFADGEYDIIHSDWMHSFIKFFTEKGYPGFGVDSFGNPKTKKPFEKLEDFWNGPKYTRGGVTDSYSVKSLLPCDDVRSLKEPKIYYPVSRIAILSDGQCGSTCELFLQKMQNIGGVRVAGIGGIWGDPMDASSFGGGNVLDTSQLLDVLDELEKSGYDRSGSPPAFKTSSGMTFDFREMYSFKFPTTVLEWGFYPAATRLPYWQTGSLMGPKVVDPNVYPQFVESDVYQDGAVCEDGTAIPCEIEGDALRTTGWQVCSGGFIPRIECSANPPAAIIDGGSSESSSSSSSGSDSSDSSDSGSSKNKKSVTNREKIFMGLAGGLGVLCVILGALVVVKSKNNSPAADPAASYQHMP